MGSINYAYQQYISLYYNKTCKSLQLFVKRFPLDGTHFVLVRHTTKFVYTEEI